MSSGGSRGYRKFDKPKKNMIRDLAFLQVWDGPRGSIRRNGVASAYKTSHKIQKIVQFLNTGYVGTVPASLTPGHSQTLKNRDPRSCDFFQGLGLVLEAVPGATELQVPIKPFVKYEKGFSS